MSFVSQAARAARPPPLHAACRGASRRRSVVLFPRCRVVELEAQRLEETRDDREQFLRSLRDELERQAAEKGVKLSLPAHSPRDGGSS